MEYGRGPLWDLAWRHKVLLPMNPPDPLTEAYTLGELIRTNYASPNGWTSFRAF
jgi:hypothetical protein